MKRVILFSIVHSVQVNGNEWCEEFTKLTVVLIQEFDCTVAMEEWGYDQDKSLLENFAERDNIEYANIGTGSEDAFATFFPIQHPGYHGSLKRLRPNAPSMNEYGPPLNQESREKEMCRNIDKAMLMHDCGIAVIGFAHTHSMTMKLYYAGYEVETFNWIPPLSSPSR